MRAIGLLAVLIAVPATAKPQKLTAKLPDIVKEAVAQAKVARGDHVVGMDGNYSAALMIKPPYHPDAEPVSKGGSWLVPPDPNDPIDIEIGTNRLRSRDGVEAWLPRDLSRSFKRGADKVWDLVLPKL